MKMRMGLVCLLVLVLALVFAAGAYADGIIIPHPLPPYPHPEWLGINYHHVDIVVNNQYTETHIDQEFYNPNHWDLEGDYVLPLPEGAVVTDFSMFVGEQELEGEVLDKEKAREIYEDYVREMKDPALLEYLDRNTFKARVYPIEAHSDKRIKMSYTEIINCDDGLCEYTYPLNTEKFSSTDIESVKIRGSITSQVPIKSLYSPTHDIEIIWIDDYNVEFSYEEMDVRPDKDFKLFYTISDEELDVNLLTYKEAGEDGFFMLMMAPEFTPPEDVLPKDVVCVLDKSGSMAGEKIEQARNALTTIINNFNEDDRFGLVTFSTEVDLFRDGLEDATEYNLQWALDYVNNIKAVGGTDIHSALLAALELFDDEERPKIILFLTDGLPTVGVEDLGKILGDVEDANEDVRIFVFGVGYEVNTHLLDKLSQENHGVSTYVEPEEDIEVKVGNLYNKISNPVMTSPEITIEGPGVYDIYPAELPDVFTGSQVRAYGRFKNLGDAVITLRGEMGDDSVDLLFEREFTSDAQNDFLPRVWASRKIGYLLDTIRLEGENEALIDDIIELSKRYGIATPYTSFLVLEDIPLEEARVRASESLDAAFAPQSGAGAVHAAESVAGFKSADYTGSNVQTIGDTQIKYAGSKAFLLKDGVWTDTIYSEDITTKKLKYGSDMFFQALADNPGLAQYLALGEEVIVCVGDTCIEVSQDYTGVEAEIGVIAPSTEPEPECQSDSDCVLDLCDCECKPSEEVSDALCGINCLGEYGVSECRCLGGQCVALGEKPPVMGSVCGDGVCHSDENPQDCPVDCRPKLEEPEPGDDQLLTLLWLVFVIVLLLVAIFFVTKVLMRPKSGKRPDKNSKAKKEVQEK